MIVDTLTRDSRASLVPAPVWEEALAFLATLGPDAAEGEYELRGKEMFARVMTYETRGAETALVEAHREYVDIQATLSGAETLEWFPASALTTRTPYDANTDVEFFDRPTGTAPSSVVLKPGVFAILFPGDGHLPQLDADAESRMVRKVVVKISVSLLEP